MKKYILIVFLILLFGFILGWIFPVEGPIDYVYDEWAENQTLKKPPTINVAKDSNVKKIEIDLNELSEDDFEVIYFIPFNNTKE